MRLSHLFGKTLRHPPKDETSINAKLLEQAGYVAKVMSGVYTFLPLGLNVLNKINSIIRDEMNALGAEELLMPALHPRDLWEKTGRWKTLAEIMYQFKDHSGRELGLGTTHEELIAFIAKRHIASYKDLPFAVYQIQTKYRDEPRAKSGLIRGREFIMKDLYSFHSTEDDLHAFYMKVLEAYRKIFTRCGLTTKVTEASGGAFTKQFSHEFQVLSEAGEDRLVYCGTCDYAQNVEVASVHAGQPCPKCSQPVLEGKGIEVGNIFKLGTRFSEAFEVSYLDNAGHKGFPLMASYGIGPGRVMGAIVEVNHDDHGIIWPQAVSPVAVHIIPISNSESSQGQVAALTHACDAAGIQYLIDDRSLSAGVKFTDADLIGVPLRAVISEKTGDRVEFKHRRDSSGSLYSISDVINQIQKK